VAPPICIMKEFIGGKKISKKEALKGLGNPETWKKVSEKVIKDFKSKPSRKRIKDRDKRIRKDID